MPAHRTQTRCEPHFWGLTTQRAPHLAHQTCMGLLNHIIIMIIIIATASSSSTSSGSGTGSGNGSGSSRIVKVLNLVFLSRLENGALNWWKWSKGDTLCLKAKIQSLDSIVEDMFARSRLRNISYSRNWYESSWIKKGIKWFLSLLPILQRRGWEMGEGEQTPDVSLPISVHFSNGIIIL